MTLKSKVVPKLREIASAMRWVAPLVITMLVGIGIAFTSWYRWLDGRTLLANGGVASAKVTSFTEDNGDDGVRMRKPTVTFTTADGRSRAVAGRFRDVEEVAVGVSMKVHYDPSDANHAILDGDEMSIFSLIVGTAAGGIFTLIPDLIFCAILLNAIREQRARSQDPSIGAH